MSKRISFTIVLALAFSVLLLFPLTASAARPPMPDHTKPVTTYYTFSGLVTKGPHKGMYLNGGLGLQITRSGKFTGNYYAPGSNDLPVKGFVNQRTGEFDVSFQKDDQHNMGPITGEGMLNSAQTQYSGEFQIANKEKQNDSVAAMHKQDDSGIWTGIPIDEKSMVTLAFRSLVKNGHDKGMIHSGVIILDKRSMKGMLVEPTGYTLACNIKKSDRGKYVTIVIGSKTIMGEGKLTDTRNGYTGLFHGPHKSDQGEWEALFIAF
ncbi:MAG TPA: hypothetical protein VL485_14655 [Ktedonobacteraceae bacterium]|nr:hypothetical protein [Ktedonobacteraceae bacterium]